jgi:outer membrane protein OmpA-like peptidoglycan-associated protein
LNIALKGFPKEQVMLFGIGKLPSSVVLKGSVLRTTDSMPISSNVKYYDLTNDNLVADQNTATDGRFSLELTRGSKYRVAAEKENYIPGGIHVDLLNEDRIEINKNIYLSPVSKGSAIRLDNVFFEFGSAKLTPSSFGELNRMVKFLEDHPEISVRIEGHTDSIGTAEYNKELSMNRARAVQKYLENKGIQGSRLLIRGYGESQPIADNKTPQGREINRRVEFVIISDGGEE